MASTISAQGLNTHDTLDLILPEKEEEKFNLPNLCVILTYHHDFPYWTIGSSKQYKWKW